MTDRGDVSTEPFVPVAYARPVKRQPGWPVAIGVISIVLAGMSLLFTPLGLISMAFTSSAMRSAGPPGMVPMAVNVLPMQIVMALVGIAKGVVLLIAGIQLVRRRPSAAALHLVYAVAGVTVAVITTVILMHSMLVLARAPMFAVMAAGLGPLMQLAYPLFVLIWFCRRSIRRQIADWKRKQLSTSPGIAK